MHTKYSCLELKRLQRVEFGFGCTTLSYYFSRFFDGNQ